MTRRSTDALIRELRRTLSPVRAIPSLRRAALVFLGLASAGATWALHAAGGPRPDLASLAAGDFVFAAIGAGLLVLGCGAAIASSALSVPGREATARIAIGAALLGGIAALAIAPACLPFLHPETMHAPGAGDVGCLLKGLGAGGAASLASVIFVWRAAPSRFAATTALAVAAGCAAGGLAQHLACPASDAMHWVAAHAAAPAVGALATLPLASIASRLWRS